jgi:hypothetical protein
MRKALIPALFVICGLVASRFWSSIGVPDGVCPVEMVGAVATGLLACTETELLAKDIEDPAFESAALYLVDSVRVRDNFTSFLSGTIEFRVHENKEK